MTTRNDVTVDFSRSPRIAEVAAPSEEFIMQDVVDTLRIAEESWRGMSAAKLLNASGKEDLGGGVLVGITVALQDALIAFEGRTTPAETGTVTTGSGAPSGSPQTYTFVDTAADFLSAGVARGSLVINFTDRSIADVYEVVNANTLRTKVLVNGIGNDFGVGDVYHVYNIVQVRATGGNLTAVDSGGSPLASGVLPTAFTQVLITSSSSATLQELTEIRYATYQNAVWVDTSGSNTGTDYPSGTPLQPVNNFPDARAIALALGFDTLRILGSATLGAGDDVSGLTLIGQNAQLTTITIEDAADVSEAQFTICTVTGILDGDSVIREATILPPLTYVEGTLYKCLIEGGTITLGGSSDVNILDCWSGVAGYDTPIIDCGGSGRDLLMRRYSGSIEIRNKTGVDDTVCIDLDSGMVILHSSVTAGLVGIRGVGLVEDNSVGATVNTTGLVNNPLVADAVWDEPTADHTGVGSFGEAIGDLGGLLPTGTTMEAYASVIYDDASDTVIMNVWATGIPSPTAAQLDWYDQDGTKLFTVTSSSPDALNHFLMSHNLELTVNRAYYAVIQVTDGSNTATSTRGMPLAGP